MCFHRIYLERWQMFWRRSKSAYMIIVIWFLMHTEHTINTIKICFMFVFQLVHVGASWNHSEVVCWFVGDLHRFLFPAVQTVGFHDGWDIESDTFSICMIHREHQLHSLHSFQGSMLVSNSSSSTSSSKVAPN